MNFFQFFLKNFQKQWKSSFLTLRLEKIKKFKQLHENQEFYQKNYIFNAIKLNSFQRKPINTLHCAAMQQQKLLHA